MLQHWILEMGIKQHVDEHLRLLKKGPKPTNNSKACRLA